MFRLSSAGKFCGSSMERAKAEHGGIHSVIIDGVGDICINVNDPAEAVSIVDELHQLAIGFYLAALFRCCTKILARTSARHADI